MLQNSHHSTRDLDAVNNTPATPAQVYDYLCYASFFESSGLADVYEFTSPSTRNVSGCTSTANQAPDRDTPSSELPSASPTYPARPRSSMDRYPQFWGEAGLTRSQENIDPSADELDAPPFRRRGHQISTNADSSRSRQETRASNSAIISVSQHDTEDTGPCPPTPPLQRQRHTFLGSRARTQHKSSDADEMYTIERVRTIDANGNTVVSNVRRPGWPCGAFQQHNMSETDILAAPHATHPVHTYMDVSRHHLHI